MEEEFKVAIFTVLDSFLTHQVAGYSTEVAKQKAFERAIEFGLQLLRPGFEEAPPIPVAGTPISVLGIDAVVEPVVDAVVEPVVDTVPIANETVK